MSIALRASRQNRRRRPWSFAKDLMVHGQSSQSFASSAKTRLPPGFRLKWIDFGSPNICLFLQRQVSAGLESISQPTIVQRLPAAERIRVRDATMNERQIAPALGCSLKGASGRAACSELVKAAKLFISENVAPSCAGRRWCNR